MLQKGRGGPHVYKLNKKQRKALRINEKYHARKHGEHRRRISNVIEKNKPGSEWQLHYLDPFWRRSFFWRW